MKAAASYLSALPRPLIHPRVGGERTWRSGLGLPYARDQGPACACHAHGADARRATSAERRAVERTGDRPSRCYPWQPAHIHVDGAARR